MRSHLFGGFSFSFFCTMPQLAPVVSAATPIELTNPSTCALRSKAVGIIQVDLTADSN